MSNRERMEAAEWYERQASNLREMAKRARLDFSADDALLMAVEYEKSAERHDLAASALRGGEAVAWLIEHETEPKWIAAGKPRRDYGLYWTAYPALAIRFARSQDANLMAWGLHDKLVAMGGYKVTEHIWDDSAPSAGSGDLLTLPTVEQRSGQRPLALDAAPSAHVPVQDAAARNEAAPAFPAAPASEPVGGESRFPCRFKENTGWCETHAQYANDADHCQGASTPSVPTAEAGVVMTEPPVDVLKRTIQNIESQEIRRSGLFIVDRVDIAILDEIVAALSTPSPQGAVAWISEVGMARLRRGQSCQAYGRGDVQPGVSPFYPAPSGVSEEMVALIADGAEWRRDDGRTYLAIRVADGADLSCVATRRAALKAALSGEGE